MSYSVIPETFDSIAPHGHPGGRSLGSDCLFVLPQWLRAWWRVFGDGPSQLLCSIRQGQELLGVAPLLQEGETAAFIGSPDVCDRLDFSVAPGRETEFFEVLLDHLNGLGVTELDLAPARPDSTVLTHLVQVARRRGAQITCHQEDVALEMDLPRTWDAYLMTLRAKQRHEVRRKIRRLREVASDINYRVVADVDGVERAMPVFFKLFAKSEMDKSSFMTEQMKVFFHSIATETAKLGLLRLCILELNSHPAAAVLCFDYNGTFHLYNSCYDPRYSELSAGILCKIYSIEYSIRNRFKKYDFLKGSEGYKNRLGGREVPLYRCRIRLA
jgi:CelD/BcsL family acetyltransferase involved in cellulose biosynthesis